MLLLIEAVVRNSLDLIVNNGPDRFTMVQIRIFRRPPIGTMLFSGNHCLETADRWHGAFFVECSNRLTFGTGSRKFGGRESGHFRDNIDLSEVIFFAA